MSELNLLLRCALDKNQDFYNVTKSVNFSNTLNTLLTPFDLKPYDSNNSVAKSVQGFNNVTDLGYGRPFHSNFAGLVMAAFTGIALPIIFDAVINNQLIESGTLAVVNVLRKTWRGKTFSRILVLTILVSVIPIITVFLVLMFVHKRVCHIIINRTEECFAGFLNGFDVFWSLEDEVTKSIINVLGAIETDNPFNLANNINERLQKLLINGSFEKIFYQRHERYGFYYWRKSNFVNVDEYVEVVKTPGYKKLDAEALENLMTDLQYKSLPFNDKGLFQILITEKRLHKHEGDKGEYGIIFRTHHSVGDGAALIEFLCQSLADSVEDPPQDFSIPDTCNNNERQHNLLNIIKSSWQIVICFIDVILRKPDQNELHGKPLTGKKIFKCMKKSDENLLVEIKEIKDKVGNLNFTDILLKALSSALQKLFKQKSHHIPDNIAAILPVRFSNRSPVNTVQLTNNFTVTTLDVPLLSDMEEIRIRCSKMRKSGDPLMNYYFLKLTTSTLPSWILKPVLRSIHATLVFSNMPGPQRISLCGGDELKSLVFFVPNKGTTGVGITALTYDGVLRLAAMADAGVASSEDLALILNGMVEEVSRMHQLYVV